MIFQKNKMNTVWNEISIPLLLVMLLCECCPGEVVCLSLGALSIYYSIRNKGIRTEMPGFWIYVFMLCCGFLMGVLHFKDTGNNLYAYVKHIYYVSFPFLMWYAGENAVKRNGISREQVYRSIVVATALLCIRDMINFTNAVVNFKEFSNTSSKIYQFRSQVGYGNYLAVIGLYILIIFQKELKLSKYVFWTCCLLHGLSILVHFSRTALLMVIVFGVVTGAQMLFAQKEALKPGRILEFCLVVGLLTGMVIIAFPEITKDFVFKIKNTFVEMSPFHDDWTLYRVSNSWRGYETYCALVRFNNADLLEKLLGGGFGATLDVFGFAYLVTTEETLPFLHNGYFTQLMVFGVVGVIAMVGWFLSMWNAAQVIRIVEDRVFALGLVACVVCMTAIVGGPMFSPSVAQLLFLMAAVRHTGLHEINNM